VVRAAVRGSFGCVQASPSFGTPTCLHKAYCQHASACCFLTEACAEWPARAQRGLVYGTTEPQHALLCCTPSSRQPEAKPAQVTASICEALQRSYIFRGMPEQLLAEVRKALTATVIE
jgi:hypothetical protein